MQADIPLNRYRALKPAGPKGQCPRGWSWEKLMRLALEQAGIAAKAFEVPVGAVVVDNNGIILARTVNRIERDRDPCAHAELLALREAAQKTGRRNMAACVLVVTLEPCLMCAGAIGLSRIGGVVFGACDARAGCLVSAAEASSLPMAGREFWWHGGICSEQCASLLQQFFADRRNQARAEQYA